MNTWFWRPGFTTQSADKSAGEYADCPKRHSNLLLNLSPDTTGRLPEEAVNTLGRPCRRPRFHRACSKFCPRTSRADRGLQVATAGPRR